LNAIHAALNRALASSIDLASPNGGLGMISVMLNQGDECAVVQLVV
jgi:hypothetical protein